VALLTWNRKRQGPQMTLMSFAALPHLAGTRSAATIRERRLPSGKLIADETEKWGKLVKFAGIKPE
jgi:hypothetical protein